MPFPQEEHGLSHQTSNTRRALMVHQGALGDFLLLLPVLEGLHLYRPDLLMDFWSKPHHVALLASRPYIGAIYPAEGGELIPFFHESLWREAPLPLPFQRAHVTFLFGQASSRTVAERLALRLERPVHWIQSFPTGGLTHVSRFLADQIRRVGWSIPEVAPPRLEPDRQERALAAAWLRARGIPCERPVVVHPGSGGRRKIWPRWWSLLHLLRERYGVPVLMVLGPADEALEGFARSAASALEVRVLEGLPLPRLAAFLAESRCYVGNDSGVSHLAAAVGVPSLVLFGPTDPRVWGPPGSHVHIVRSKWEESEALSPHAAAPQLEPTVREALEALLVT